MCRREISKGIFTSAGKRGGLQIESWENHGVHNVVLACVSRVSSAGLSLMAKMSCSLHIRLSDMCFPTGTRPDLDIEQRITPIERFLGSLIYI